MPLSTKGRALAIVFGAAAGIPAVAQSRVELAAIDEYRRPDPFGSIVAADGGAALTLRRELSFESARGSYVSFHLIVKMARPGVYSLAIRFAGESGKLQADLFREWFHFTDSDKKYYPDALIPVAQPYQSRIPEPDNRIPNQTAQAFWVDFWIPRDAAPAVYRAHAVLKSEGASSELPIQLKVLPAVVPNDDVLLMDHNSYGTSWLADDYPAISRRLGDAFFQSDEFFRLIHSITGSSMSIEAFCISSVTDTQEKWGPNLLRRSKAPAGEGTLRIGAFMTGTTGRFLTVPHSPRHAAAHGRFHLSTCL